MYKFNTLVSTYNEWLDVQEIPYDNNKGWTEEQEKEYELVSKILATEQAIYIMRRTVGVDGSIIDAMRNLFCQCRNEYEESMGKVYYDANKDIDF